MSATKWIWQFVHGWPRFDFQFERQDNLLLAPNWHKYVEVRCPFMTAVASSYARVNSLLPLYTPLVRDDGLIKCWCADHACSTPRQE